MFEFGITCVIESNFSKWYVFVKGSPFDYVADVRMRDGKLLTRWEAVTGEES